MPLQQEWLAQGNFLFRYRSFLPVVLLPLALLVIYNNVRIRPELYCLCSFCMYDALIVLVGLIGLLIRIVTVGHTPANTSGRNTTEGQVADTVNRTGIYATVRHPLYLGNYLMWLSIAMVTKDIWFVIAFTLAYWLYYERIMYAEESFLTGKFGSIYTDWASITPAFIPDITKWTKPSIPFSIKKVLKKEKNGLFALFLLLAVLYIWIDYLKSGDVQAFSKPWSIYAAFITGVIYLILKILKRTTSLFNEEGR
jgi:protein-S-isoprenylcysteine O-methyltransferase Ste14